MLLHSYHGLKTSDNIDPFFYSDIIDYSGHIIQYTHEAWCTNDNTNETTNDTKTKREKKSKIDSVPLSDWFDILWRVQFCIKY